MKSLLLLLSGLVIGGSVVVITGWWYGRVSVPVVMLVVLGVGLVMSMLSFIVCGWDKIMARRKKGRVREWTLHKLELLGGWPGSVLAQELFRHKTVKRSYRRWFMVIVVIHLLVLVGAGWLSFR